MKTSSRLQCWTDLLPKRKRTPKLFSITPQHTCWDEINALKQTHWNNSASNSHKRWEDGSPTPSDSHSKDDVMTPLLLRLKFWQNVQQVSCWSHHVSLSALWGNTHNYLNRQSDFRCPSLLLRKVSFQHSDQSIRVRVHPPFRVSLTMYFSCVFVFASKSSTQNINCTPSNVVLLDFVKYAVWSSRPMLHAVVRCLSS